VESTYIFGNGQSFFVSRYMNNENLLLQEEQWNPPTTKGSEGEAIKPKPPKQGGTHQ
jgi:hypothetical protein